MAASGFTPISLYYSATASNVPLAANLANGELALNTADMKLYAKNSSGVVTLLAASSGATGTVSTVSVVSANGLAGTVANATTTPAITLSTTVTGVLKGNGTAISAAVSGTDYAPATSGTSRIYTDSVVPQYNGCGTADGRQPAGRRVGAQHRRHETVRQE